MSAVLELKEQRAKLANEAKKVIDLVDSEKRRLTGEEQEKIDKIYADCDSLKKEIEKREKVNALETEMAEVRRAPRLETTEKATKDNVEETAFRYFLQRGMSGMPTEYRTALEKRAISEGGMTGFGVSDGFDIQVQNVLKSYAGVENAPVSVEVTETGNQYPILIDNDTSNTGELLAEGSTAGSGDPSFTQVTLGAYMFSSRLVPVSIQALQDISRLEANLTDRLGVRLARIRNSFFTTGTGSSQPQGVVTAAAANTGVTGATGQTGTVIYDNLVDLEHSIDPAYRQMKDKCGFMLHDNSVAVIKKIKDTLGRPLWLPGLAVDDPDTINGYRYYVNNFMAQMAASAKSILFGYWPGYTVRNVKGIVLRRLDERYADSLQVGYIAFQRADGRCTLSNSIAYYANSAS